MTPNVRDRNGVRRLKWGQYRPSANASHSRCPSQSLPSDLHVRLLFQRFDHGRRIFPAPSLVGGGFDCLANRGVAATGGGRTARSATLVAKAISAWPSMVNALSFDAVSVIISEILLAFSDTDSDTKSDRPRGLSRACRRNTFHCKAFPAGLEPATFGSGGRRSVQLSYGNVTANSTPLIRRCPSVR